MSIIAGVLVGIAITIRLPIIYLPFLFILFTLLTDFFWGHLLKRKLEILKYYYVFHWQLFQVYTYSSLNCGKLQLEISY